MRNTLFAIALSLAGAAALSTTASATALPGIAPKAETAIAAEMLQPVGGYWWQVHKKRHGKRFFKFGKTFVRFPKGYYNGFCYDYPHHWWCKKYFFKVKKHRFNFNRHD